MSCTYTSSLNKPLAKCKANLDWSDALLQLRRCRHDDSRAVGDSRSRLSSQSVLGEVEDVTGAGDRRLWVAQQGADRLELRQRALSLLRLVLRVRPWAEAAVKIAVGAGHCCALDATAVSMENAVPCIRRSSIMSYRLRFDQVDVFTDRPYKGNPLAVVHDAHGLGREQMAEFARWTNLSETTFLLPPKEPEADYRVRIFTPGGEIPFAGHPTLGSCHAWLGAGGTPRASDMVVQECGVGLVRIRCDTGRLAFAAPPLRRSGPLDPQSLQRIVQALGLASEDIIGHQWVDNGPGWCALMLKSAERVLAVRPDWAALGEFRLGLAGPLPSGADADFEVRAFVPSLGIPEDPVTGSLNASLAQWLIGAGLARDHYTVRQGTALGRAGKVFLERMGGDIWVGGRVIGCISGTVEFPSS